MKKILLTFVFVLTISLFAYAQATDSFFRSNYDDVYGNRIDYADSYTTPRIPTYQGGNQSAPLGTGIFLLTALGAGYAISKRCKEER